MSTSQFVLWLSLAFNVGLGIALWNVIKHTRVRSNELAHSRSQTVEAESRTAIALAGADLGVWEWRLSDEQFVVSEAGLAILGYTPQEFPAMASRWQALIHPQDAPQRAARVQAYLKAPSTRYECEFRIRHKQGHWIWVMERGRLLDANAPRQAQMMVGTFFDISARKNMEQQLLRMAATDELTGLPNRRVFQERLAMEWARLKRQPGQVVTVALCDIDHFKRINDTYGHDAGDMVLKHFASTLANTVRKNDLAARLGGEEFAVILQDDTPDSAQAWAERFRLAVAASTLTYGDHVLAYTVSIGLAQLRADMPAAGEALKQADHTLYRAKGNGRNQIAVAVG